VIRWDVISGKELLTEVPDAAVDRMAFSPDGKRVTAMYRSRMTGPGSIRSDFVIWDIASAKPIEYSQKFPANPSVHFVSSENLISPNSFYRNQYPTCSPDGRTIPVVLVGKEKPERRQGPQKDDPRQRINHIHWMMIGLWDVRNEKMVREFEVDIDWSSEDARSKDGESLRHLVLSPDCKLLAGWAGYNSIFVWDLAKGVELRRWTFPNFPGPRCNALAFSRNGKALISSHHQWRTKRNTFYVHDLATGEERAKVECAIDIDHVGCGPVFASDRLAALAVGKTVYLIDPKTGAKLREFNGQLQDITCLAFSANRKFLATGSADTTILIWNVTGI
jgi:hypothetical protein